MAVRVLLVPGIFLVDVPVGVQVVVILGAALSQLVAVVDANTPPQHGAKNPNLHPGAEERAELPASTEDRNPATA
jgi:hypothetical protein